MDFNQYWEDVGEYGAYGLSSLAEKIRMSNHLEMLQQRQHILLSYFKTPSVVAVLSLNPQLPARQEHLRDVERNDKNTSSKPVARQFNLLNLFSLHLGYLKGCKTPEQRVIFQIGTFHSHSTNEHFSFS